MIPEKLKQFGAVETGSNRGFIPIQHPATEPEIVKYDVKDVTPLIRQIKYDVVRNFTYRNIETFREYHMEGLFRKVCIKYINPKILFQLIPFKIRNVTFHWGGLYFTGEIVNSFTNNSKPGKEGKCKQWRWKPCPNNLNDYYWQTIPDSDILSSNWIHNMFEQETGVQIVNSLKQVANGIKPNTSVEVVGQWKTQNLGDTAWTLLQILTTGTITTRNGFNVKVSYKWKGETQTLNKKVDAVVVVPIEGNINWVAW